MIAVSLFASQSVALDTFTDNAIVVLVVFAVCCVVFGVAAYITRDDNG